MRKIVLTVALLSAALSLPACNSTSNEEVSENRQAQETHDHDHGHSHDNEKSEYCQDDNGSGDKIRGLIFNPQLSLDNVQIIETDTGETIIGGSIKEGDHFVSNSETWIITAEGDIENISQTAGRYTNTPGNDLYTMIDQGPTLVDQCVIIESGLLND